MIPSHGDRLSVIKREMDDLRSLIRTSLADQPDDFDGREHLWMLRETLRGELDGLLQPSLGQRLAQWLGLDRVATRMFPSVGAYAGLCILEMIVVGG